MLVEKDAALVGFDCYDFPECKNDSIGFGGTFRNRMVNCPVRLTFGKDNNAEFCVHHDSGFRLVLVPPNTSKEDREKLIGATPSVLGMDIVLDKFKLYVDKRKVELTTLG